MSDELEDLSMCEPDVTTNSWLTHFESLHAKHTMLGTEQQHTLNQLEKLEEKIANKYVDEAISENEIINAARKLKNNKSAYSDKIRNEMLKSSSKRYQKPFNLILESGKFPDQRGEGLITPIFKSGDKTNSNNYRGRDLCDKLSEQVPLYCSKRTIK
jgi:hypothetical protein